MLIILDIFSTDVSLEENTLRSLLYLFHELSFSIADIIVESGLILICLQIFNDIESTVLSSTFDVVELIRECFSVAVFLGEINETLVKSETDHGLSSELCLVMQHFVVGSDFIEQLFWASVSSRNWWLHDAFQKVRWYNRLEVTDQKIFHSLNSFDWSLKVVIFVI
jgi:hypothetical protein